MVCGVVLSLPPGDKACRSGGAWGFQRIGCALHRFNVAGSINGIVPDRCVAGQADRATVEGWYYLHYAMSNGKWVDIWCVIPERMTVVSRLEYIDPVFTSSGVIWFVGTPFCERRVLTVGPDKRSFQGGIIQADPEPTVNAAVAGKGIVDKCVFDFIINRGQMASERLCQGFGIGPVQGR